MNNAHTKLNISLTYIATVLFWCSLYVYVPVLGTYCAMMGSSYIMIGTILSSYGFVQLILRIPIGMLSDRIGKRKLFMLAGLGCSIVSGLVFFFGKTPPMMLLGRSLAGVSAATWAVFMVNFAGFYPRERQSEGMGIAGMTVFMGQVPATILGGVLAAFLSEKITFLISALVGILGLLFVLLVPERTEIDSNPPGLGDFLAMLKNRDLLYFSFLAVILMIAVYAGILGFIPNLLKELGSSNLILGVATAFGSLFSIVTSMFSGTFFENKLGFKFSIIISFILIALTLVLMGFTSNITMLLILSLLTSAPRGLVQTMLNSLAVRGIKPQLRSAAASVFQSIYGLGMTIGPIVTGILTELYGITNAFIVIGLFTLLAVVIVSFRKKWPVWAE